MLFRGGLRQFSLPACSNSKPLCLSLLLSTLSCVCGSVDGVGERAGDDVAEAGCVLGSELLAKQRMFALLFGSILQRLEAPTIPGFCRRVLKTDCADSLPRQMLLLVLSKTLLLCSYGAEKKLTGRFH